MFDDNKQDEGGATIDEEATITDGTAGGEHGMTTGATDIEEVQALVEGPEGDREEEEEEEHGCMALAAHDTPTATTAGCRRVLAAAWQRKRALADERIMFMAFIESILVLNQCKIDVKSINIEKVSHNVDGDKKGTLA